MSERVIDRRPSAQRPIPRAHPSGRPTILARISREELTALFEGYAYRPVFVEGDDPAFMHERMAAALDDVMDEIAAIQRAVEPSTS